jgi:hypothetical protein
VNAQPPNVILGADAKRVHGRDPRRSYLTKCGVRIDHAASFALTDRPQSCYSCGEADKPTNPQPPMRPAA